MIFVDRVTGATRPMDITDLHRMVSPLQLGAFVPHDIREQFDKARNAFLYSWFAYDLATLAEQQTYAVVEMALRERLTADKLAVPSRSGLAKLLKAAISRGWLIPAEFDTGGINLLDVLPILRNELTHGSTHLMPYGTPLRSSVSSFLIKRGGPRRSLTRTKLTPQLDACWRSVAQVRNLSAR
jgi:hypothetical protein